MSCMQHVLHVLHAQPALGHCMGMYHMIHSHDFEESMEVHDVLSVAGRHDAAIS